MKNKILRGLVPVSLLLIAIATLEPLVLHPMMPGAWFRYLYAAGALLLLLSRLFTDNHATDLRLKRLYRIESWSALFFCVAAFFMFYGSTSLRDWLAFTLAGASLQVFTSLAIPARQRKIAGKTHK